MSRRAATTTALLGVLLAATGCAGDAAAQEAPTVTVAAGSQEIDVDASQYCLDGDGQRYAVTPPVVEVPADTTIALTVDPAVAEQGWGVQVFDQDLQEVIGRVEVDAGTTTLDEINSSDIVPASFYLVVVEDSDDECSGLSGAWPVGFIRSGDGELTEPTG